MDFYENIVDLNLKLRRNFRNLYYQFCIYENLVVYKADREFKELYGIHGFDFFEPSQIIDSTNILMKTFRRLANANFKQYLVNSISCAKYKLIKSKSFSKNRCSIQQAELFQQIVEDFKLIFGVDSDEESSDEESSDEESSDEKNLRKNQLCIKNFDDEDSDDEYLDDEELDANMEILATIRTNRFFFIQIWDIIFKK